jgi:hypothetical protein
VFEVGGEVWSDETIDGGPDSTGAANPKIGEHFARLAHQPAAQDVAPRRQRSVRGRMLEIEKAVSKFDHSARAVPQNFVQFWVELGWVSLMEKLRTVPAEAMEINYCSS